MYRWRGIVYICKDEVCDTCCDFIVYFVYDSAETPTNPRGTETDLSKTHGNEVFVVIDP